MRNERVDQGRPLCVILGGRHVAAILEDGLRPGCERCGHETQFDERPHANRQKEVDVLIGVVQELSVQPEAVRGGCPLLNLAQEMSPLDAGFRQRLATIFRNWQDGVAAALQRGQKHAKVRRDLNPAQAAGLLIAMVEGYGSLAKNAQDAKVMKEGIENIVEWLRSLRPPGNRKRS